MSYIENKVAYMNTVVKHLRKGFTLISAFVILSLNTFSQDINTAGEELFNLNCASCHRTDEKKVTGPGLEGVMDRVPSVEWMKSWIKNNQQMIADGDEYGNKIYNEYGQAAMTVFDFLSDEDVDNIIAYVQNPRIDGPPIDLPGNAYGDVAEWKTPGTFEEESNITTWLIVITFLLVVISVFAGLNKHLKNLKAEREGKEINNNLSIFESIAEWAGNNKKYATILGIIVTFMFMGALMNSLYNIGVFGGATHKSGAVAGFKNVEANYKPTQPIAFPHDLHAGKNEIDCQYCHSASRNGRTAGIPSVNVCMNCHNAVTEGQRTGSTEINKIYEAAGWDVDKRQYNHGTDENPTWENQPREDKPIEWIKVHNLPDFVYFNHSQHVEVGKIECQTCHGPVEKMDQAEQFAPLTMKWCIECHRETEVTTEGNEYYDRIHEEAKEAFKHLPAEDFKLTVDKIGGLECGKCHY
jgi:cytochrome c2